MARKRRRKKNIVPPRGPATNLRPAGAHKSKKLYDRRETKAALEEEENGPSVEDK
jgi:hypothetical protein